MKSRNLFLTRSAQVLGIIGALIVVSMVAACTTAALPVRAPTASAVPTLTLAPQPTATALPPTAGLPEGDFIVKYMNLTVKATLHGQGDLVVVMANQGSNNTYLWEPLAKKLVEKGFVAVNFTYAIADMGSAPTELDLVLDYLVQKGKYRRIVCIGGSMGGTACGRESRRAEIVGMALLAGGDAPDLSDAKYPKLFVAGEYDSCCVGFMQTSYEAAADPKELKIFPGTGAHAVDLFSSEFSDELVAMLVKFVEKLR
jgi:hypothetical protein